MCFSIWQGITLGTPGCTPFGIYYAPSPVSTSIQHPNRYVRTKLRCPGPLVSFQSQDTAQRLLHHPRSYHTPCTLPCTRTAPLDQGPRSLCEAASLFLVSPHPRTSTHTSPCPLILLFLIRVGSCSSTIEILARPHVYAC